MEQENKKLGDLYKETFKDIEEPGNPYDWNDVEKRLEKIKFYRLSFTHFNIYYSMLIFACFIASITSATHYFLVTVPNAARYNAVELTDSIHYSKTFIEPGITYTDSLQNKVIERTPKKEFASSVKQASNPDKGNSKTRQLTNASISASKTTTKEQESISKHSDEFILPIVDNININVNKKADSSYTVAPVHHQKDSLKVHKAPKTSQKTIYITKQDTIFEYDTLKTKKNKKFKR